MSNLRHLRPLLVRGIIVLVGLGLITGTLAVAYLEIGRDQTVVLPNPSGPYQVGRTVYDWVDPARDDPLAPSSSAKRELLVWVWYPAARSASGAATADYLPADWRKALEQDRSFIGSQLFQDLACVQVHSIAGAGLSDARQRYPVLVFMPGYGNVAPYYTTLAEDLASHGYVVVAINPTYTATIVFPDGRVTRRTPAGTFPETSDAGTMMAGGDRLVSVWAADARFALDRLAQLNATQGGEFAGRLDLSRIGIFGHSLGGAAALEACRQDGRLRAGIDLDGTLYGDVAQLGLEQPAMFLLSGGAASAPVAEQAERMPKSIDGERQSRDILTIEGTRHFNFSDYAVTFGPTLRLLRVVGLIDGRRGLEIAETYVQQFFDHYLSGQPAPLLTGPSPEFPEVTGTFHGGG